MASCGPIQVINFRKEDDNGQISKSKGITVRTYATAVNDFHKKASGLDWSKRKESGSSLVMSLELNS